MKFTNQSILDYITSPVLIEVRITKANRRTRRNFKKIRKIENDMSEGNEEI